MSRWTLAYAHLLLGLLTLAGGCNYWLSVQRIDEQTVISGTVDSLDQVPVRTRGSSVHYELLIKIRGSLEIFRVPVRYAPAIPGILESVQPGDSITAYYSSRSLSGLRSSIELVHLIHKKRVLLDFYKVQAASRRTAVVCASGVALNVVLLVLAYRKRELRAWWRNTRESRRFFA